MSKKRKQYKKYSKELRLMAAEDYLSGGGSMREICKKYGISSLGYFAGMIQSMSRVGRCLDNAPMEGWWGILKSEMYYLKKFTSRESLVSAIENYIHFYNTRRYQKRLNCMTPCEYYFATAA